MAKREKKTLVEYEQILDQSTNPLVGQLWQRLKETMAKERELKYTLVDEIPTSIDLFSQKFKQIMQEHNVIMNTLETSLNNQQQSCRSKLEKLHHDLDHGNQIADIKILNLMKELQDDIQKVDVSVNQSLITKSKCKLNDKGTSHKDIS